VSSVLGQLHGRLLQFPHFEECSPGVICEPFTFHILGELQKKTLSQGREGEREGQKRANSMMSHLLVTIIVLDYKET
jgi:hypothetical protein